MYARAGGVRARRALRGAQNPTSGTKKGSTYQNVLPFLVPLQGSNRKPARKVGFLGGFVRAGFGLAEPCVNLVMCKKYLVIHG